MNNKYLLYDKFNKLDPNFNYPLNEGDDRVHYLSKLNENDSPLLNKLSETFSEYGKLTGNIDTDQKYLKEFSSLLEDDNFDPFTHLRGTDKIDEKQDCVLYITPNNAKLDHPSFSLPAGYSCPFADVCKSLVPRNREKKDGKLIQDLGDIRCYAASEEARYKNAQSSRWRNQDLLDEHDKEGKIDLIIRSLDYYERKHGKIDIFRIHASGDFYSMDYFDAWLGVAKRKPNILFYAYTKSLPFWIVRRTEIPDNLKLIASDGGKRDELISKYDLRHAVVVNSPDDARKLELPIDIDDTLAHNSDGNFALLIHGSQKAGTERSKQSTLNRERMKKIKSGNFDV